MSPKLTFSGGNIGHMTTNGIHLTVFIAFLRILIIIVRYSVIDKPKDKS